MLKIIKIKFSTAKNYKMCHAEEGSMWSDICAVNDLKDLLNIIEDPRWQIKQNTRQLIGVSGQGKMPFSIPTSLDMDITAEHE